MRRILLWTCVFVFMWGCSAQVSIDDGGLLAPQEKASLIDFVKRALKYFDSRGFHFDFKEISLEIWRSSSFIFHNFTYAEDGKLRIILDKSDIEGPHGMTIIAHEIFHGFQRSYFHLPNKKEYAWLTEGTAIAMAVEFTGEDEVLEEFSLDGEKSILENADASCWFWQHCLKKKEDFVLKFFSQIKEENLMGAEKIYSRLEEFYRENFSKELDSWLEDKPDR